MDNDTATHIEKMMTKHFKDDDVRFARIDKNHEEIKEIMKINGQHFSFFNENLSNIKNIIDYNSKKDEEHRKRVEPMLLSYEENSKESIALGKIRERWSGRIKKAGLIAGSITAIGILLSSIWNHIK